MRLVLPTMIALWVLNVLFVAADFLINPSAPRSVQLLLLFGAVTLTGLWASSRSHEEPDEGVEYRAAYRRGHMDAICEQREQQRSRQRDHEIV